MDDPFESAWLKWAMAVVNAETLRDNVTTLAAQPNLQVESVLVQYYDAKRHCIVLLVESHTNPFPAIWGLLLGDVVHDFKCCLDHTAWALYKRGKTPNLSAKQERNVYFPIADSRGKFNAAIKTKLPGVRLADIAIVRRYQPYERGKTNVSRHIFMVLDALSNADKHRTIQPVIAGISGFEYRNLVLADCVLTRVGPPTGRGSFHPGTELARFYVRKTGPKPHADMQPRFTFIPAINERLTLLEFLVKTMKATSVVLSEFGEPPRSVHALLDSLASVSPLRE